MPSVAESIRCTFQAVEPIALAASAADNATWVNVAKAGSYWHPKHKNFALTSEAFRAMVSNFKSGVYPESPYELLCDYDHLSLRPKAPDDSKAAGWIKDLETRENDRELWARVEFTPPAIEKIRNKEYRFLSGVFSPKWHTFRGKELAWTFLGLAITNMPTLQSLPEIGLSAIPCSASAHFPETIAVSDLSVITPDPDPVKEPRMAGKKTNEQTITVKAEDGQDVTIALSALGSYDEVLALGRATVQQPDPATIVARQDFDALNDTVKTLSTELADERAKRLAAEENDRKRTVSEWIRTGMIFPKEEALALSNYDLFAGLVKDRGTVVVLNREQGSGGRAKDEGVGYAGASESLREKAAAYAEAHKVPFAEAVIAVSTSTAADTVAERAMALRREHSL